MKKQKAMNSDLVAFFQAWLKKMLPNHTIADMFMQNSHIVAVLDSGLHIKIKQ